MLGSIVELEPLGKPQCFHWRECLVERTFVVRVQVVAHHYYFLRIRVYLICEPFHLSCPVNLRPVLQGCCMSKTCKRLRKQKYAACAIADVFTILSHGAIAFAMPFAGFPQQLQRLFVHADNGIPLVIHKKGNRWQSTPVRVGVTDEKVILLSVKSGYNWANCGNAASMVGGFDAEEIRDNFTYKAFNSIYGTIYF